MGGGANSRGHSSQLCPKNTMSADRAVDEVHAKKRVHGSPAEHEPKRRARVEALSQR